jgi:hypothetical protein
MATSDEKPISTHSAASAAKDAPNPSPEKEVHGEPLRNGSSPEPVKLESVQDEPASPETKKPGIGAKVGAWFKANFPVLLIMAK